LGFPCPISRQTIETCGADSQGAILPQVEEESRFMRNLLPAPRDSMMNIPMDLVFVSPAAILKLGLKPGVFKGAIMRRIWAVAGKRQALCRVQPVAKYHDLRG
jgi:hypothetical protein